MSSLARSSSVMPAPVALAQPSVAQPAVALAHSANSSGRMGFFVDTATCSCSGCADYRDCSEPVDVSPPPAPSGLGGLGWGLAARPLTFSMGSTRSVVPEAAADPLSLDETTAHTLRLLRARLQARQDTLYEGETRSHDEAAAKDAEWEELDNQIHAIEALLISFRMIFRHR